MQIFTEDMDEVKSLPRENVLNFIEKADETLVVPYLVHYTCIILFVTEAMLLHEQLIWTITIMF